MRALHHLRWDDGSRDRLGPNDEVKGAWSGRRDRENSKTIAADLLRLSTSGEVDGETLEIGERAIVEGAFVSSPQDHAGRMARLQRLLPAGRTQAPTVAGRQAGKAVLRHRRRKIMPRDLENSRNAAVMTAQSV